jgi:hypothetical protein
MPPTDPFNHITSQALTDHYENAVAVAPNDANDLQTCPRALLATTTAGTVAVHMKGQSAVVTLYLALGIPLTVRVDRVLSTGTVAAGIVALW